MLHFLRKTGNLEHTQESRAKMSAAHRKRLENPEERARQAAAAKKRWANPEERAKMSPSQKGAKNQFLST